MISIPRSVDTVSPPAAVDVEDAIVRLRRAEAAEAAGRTGEAWTELRLAYAASLPTGALPALPTGALPALPTDAPPALPTGAPPALIAAETAADLATLAGALAAAGRLEEAGAALALARESGPPVAAVLLETGRLELAAGRPGPALAALERATILEPGLAEAHRLAAEALTAEVLTVDALTAAGQGEAALARLQAAVAAAPDLGVAHCRLGGLWRRRNQPEAALAAYRRALIAEPGDVEALHGASAVLRDTGRPAEALGLARRALALAPHDPWRQVQLGNVLSRLGRSAEAAEAYQAALARDPALPGVAAALAGQMAALGRPAEAAALLGLAAAETPRQSGPMLAAARMYRRAGRPAEAVPWLRRALALAPSPALHAELEQARLACGRGADEFPSDLPADPRLREALARLEASRETGWGPAGRAGLGCVALGGGDHNTLYRLSGAGFDLALRLERFPAVPWYAYELEARNVRAAAARGFGPELVMVDSADGTMVTGFVAGTQMTARAFRADEGRLLQAAELYRRLHAGPPLAGRHDMFTLLEPLRRRVPALGGGDFTDLGALDRRFETVAGLLRASRPPLRPGHNDPVALNFVALPDRLVLLDWQCAGQADPHWEVGAFTVENALSDAQADRFLAAYAGDAEAPAAARAALFGALSEYYWLLQGLAWAGEGREPETWRHRSRDRRRRLVDFLDGPRFARAVARLRSAQSMAADV
jgi:tetratricopeptide (TPR) repeat protein